MHFLNTVVEITVKTGERKKEKGIEAKWKLLEAE